jgi:hypothetical protein
LVGVPGVVDLECREVAKRALITAVSKWCDVS